MTRASTRLSEELQPWASSAARIFFCCCSNLTRSLSADEYIEGIWEAAVHLPAEGVISASGWGGQRSDLAGGRADRQVRAGEEKRACIQTNGAHLHLHCGIILLLPSASTVMENILTIQSGFGPSCQVTYILSPFSKGRIENSAIVIALLPDEAQKSTPMK